MHNMKLQNSEYVEGGVMLCERLNPPTTNEAESEADRIQPSENIDTHLSAE